MTAPSVAEVMRSVSSRAPSMRCVGRERRDDPAVDDRADGGADEAADGGGADAEDRAADAAANGGAGRTEDEGRHGASRSKGKGKTDLTNRTGCFATDGRRSDPGHAVPATRMM